MKPILTYVQLAARNSEVDFCVLHPESVLVLGTFESVDDSCFQTLGSGAELSDGAIYVAPVKKGHVNAFGGMITIGRARNNDIQIREASVSKFHAYLRDEPGTDQLTLVDANSTCGTWVNGTKLSPQPDKVSIGSGDQLQLGMVPAVLYGPQEFYGLLSELLDGRSPKWAPAE